MTPTALCECVVTNSSLFKFSVEKCTKVYSNDAELRIFNLRVKKIDILVHLEAGLSVALIIC